MPTQISLRGVTVSRGDRLLLDDVSFSARPGERVGVVGENGAGKSTLLRLIAGMDRPDEGEVITIADGETGYLAQAPQLSQDQTVGDAIDRALEGLRRMERRLRVLESALGDARSEVLEEYGELLTAFEARGGYEADVRVDKALQALNLAHVGRERQLGELSGGEQARLGLACLIAAAPEVMLLDEPTNHLDAPALTWLEDALRAHPGTVLAISHDRVFLERVATAILEVDADRRALVRYGGGYPGFMAERAAARQRWEEAYRQWCADTAELSEFAATTAPRVAPGRARKDGNKMAYGRDEGRVQASVSSRVRNAQERLRRLQADPVPRPPDVLRFAARPAQGAAGGQLVALDEVRVADRLSVHALSVRAGERLLIHGDNGAGKTTLLRLMAGVATPDSGRVHRRGRIGYLAQEIPVDNPRERLLAVFGRGLPDGPDEHAQRLLSYGLFRERDLHVPVGSLSVGQRRRLALARLLARPMDLLLLDEPTNHLALGLVEELEAALARWQGALVVVTHDRLLRARFAGEHRELRRGRLVPG
ncbi:ABC-F family ATP-binding cassette domain-containing protein [Streptomyces buecherae]|uniref:ABC-F family ATP-binding cassette domain-containing protein n=1 Tax=Streptomyces buecherae TaxID=2763006 RepID=A0A7H8NE67_9ACTN|nr:ABC-F family ATP-binding cassette domain-containing protein [Streptomyces buecherae]QKW52780.1 ABC-F family ATP-binding cassette domain-containing protein [Streptomyces buecherae]